jgi:hypothetical protein
MGIVVEERRIKNIDLGDNSNDVTDFLNENIMDVVELEVDFRVESYVKTTGNIFDDGDISIVLNPSTTLIDQIPDSRYIICDTPGAFADWFEGDRITCVGSADPINLAFRTILAKISDEQILMDAPYNAETLPIGAYLYNSTQITGVDFFHNLVENDSAATFDSLVDGTNRRARATGLDNTVLTETPMTQLGNKSYQYGNLSIRGNNEGAEGIVDISQGFTVTQTLVIDPLFLANEINDIKNNIAPVYWLNDNSLKYVFRIEAGNNINDPNKKKEVEDGEILGNSGWTDENFNTGITNYSVDTSTVSYKKADNSPNGGLELTSDLTKLSFDINNTVDSPFSNGNTRFVIAFHILPQPENEYRLPEFPTGTNLAKDRLMKENFLFDRAPTPLGSSNTAPDNLGTTIQIFKNATFTYISNSKVRADIQFELAQEVVDKISGLSAQEFRITVSTVNHTLSRIESDRVNLRVDVDQFFVDTTDPTMVIQSPHSFMEHPFSDVDTEAVSNLTARVEDDILAISKFTIDTNGRETDTILLTGATAEIIASNGTSEFVLDSYNASLSNSQLVNGIPFLDITHNRGFKTPADSNRANVKIFSDTALDAGGIFNYSLQFPFILRWEDWIPNLAAAGVFFDVNELNNGLNQEWVRYTKTAGWDIYFRSTINATKNGTPQTYTTSTIIQTEDYTEGVFWDTEAIKTFVNATNDSLFDGSNYLLESDANSRVEGEATYTGVTPPLLAVVGAQLRINEYQNGDFKAQYYLSSFYDAHIDTPWLSVDSLNRVVTDGSGTPIFKFKGLMSGSFLDNNKTYKLSCRIWDLTTPPPPFPQNQSKLMEDGTLKELEDTGYKILDQ